jgi:hypothetical protein
MALQDKMPPVGVCFDRSHQARSTAI